MFLGFALCCGCVIVLCVGCVMLWVCYVVLCFLVLQVCCGVLSCVVAVLYSVPLSSDFV